MNFKDYIKGKRHGTDANRFEQEAQNDPFLMEAIDGFDENPDETHLSVIEQLEKDILQKSTVKKTFTRRIWYISIAASLALLLGVSFFFRQQNPNEMILAENTILSEKKEEKIENRDISTQNIDNKLIAQHTPKITPQTVQLAAVEKDMIIAESERIVEMEDYKMVAAEMTADEYVFVEVEEQRENAFAKENLAEKQLAALLAKTDVAEEKHKISSDTISGKVIDLYGEPLIGATVMVKGTNKGTVTDIDGNFNLAVDKVENNEIQVAFIGYDTKTVAADKSSTVIMNENQLALSEVVATGFGTSRERSQQSAEEFNEEKFLKYFDENARKIECKEENPSLKSEFFIDKNGNPSKIEIIECNCEKLEKEFRRVLKQTKNWTNTNETISIEIRI
jgi:hypothetical protein